MRNVGSSLEKMLITSVWIPNLSLIQVSPRVYCLNKQNPSPKNKAVSSACLLLSRNPRETRCELVLEASGFLFANAW